jgi:hypothetical protein
MSANSAQLLADIEKEMRADRETLAETFSEAQRAIASNDVGGLTAIASRASRRRARAAKERHGVATEGRKANTNICSGNRTGNKLSKTEEHRETENPMNPGLIT